MKKILWLVAGALIALGAVIVLKPQLLEGVLPGLWAGKHKNAVRARATELIRYLAADDLDTCVQYVDPVFVREHGARAVKLRFGVAWFIAKAGKVTAADVEIGEIRLNADNTEAEVDCRIRVKGEWKAQKPGRWVRVNGQWYTRID